MTDTEIVNWLKAHLLSVETIEDGFTIVWTAGGRDHETTAPTLREAVEKAGKERQR